MAIQQPTATDKLNSPSHSLSHRVIANDDASPNESVYVNAVGNFNIAKGLIENVVIVTDTYAILDTDSTIVCNKPTAFTATLPTAVVGQRFNIKNIGAGIVTLAATGADTIDIDTTQALSQWDCITVQCYLANKWIII
jgi:hypothetical protein